MTPTFRRVVKYQHHVYRHTNIDNILDYLRAPDLERGSTANIGRDTDVPEPALRGWHCHRAVSANWFPRTEGKFHVPELDPEWNSAVADSLVDNSIQTGIGTTRTHLKDLCLDSYGAQTDDERHLERFCASTIFLQDMGRHQGLSMRTLHQNPIRNFIFSIKCPSMPTPKFNNS
jgi:hypothetical protein